LEDLFHGIRGRSFEQEDGLDCVELYNMALHGEIGIKHNSGRVLSHMFQKRRGLR
jgi:hypothetical protein